MIIGTSNIERDSAPFVIAEIGVNHDGKIAKAIALIDAAAAAKCHAVKFQLFRADLLLAGDAGLVDYQKQSADSATELLEPLQLSAAQMQPLVAHAKKLGLAAIVTPFSPALVPDCVTIGIDAIKLASPDLVNRPLLEAAAATGLPLILSSGAAELAEIERTVGWLWKLGAAERTVLLHCVSSYPTAADHATLGAITFLRQRFAGMPIGYSDHTTETLTAALAAACGASVLEKHLTLDRSAKGPDHAASLEPAQMAEYCRLAREGHAMRGPFAKNVLPEELAVRKQTRQSVVALADLKAGTVITRDHLTVKRPGTGIPAADMHVLIGKTLARDVRANSVLQWPDFGETGNPHQERTP